MNKLLTKIASLFFGMGLAIGVGAAIGNQRPLEARAEEATLTATNYSGGNITGTGITWTGHSVGGSSYVVLKQGASLTSNGFDDVDLKQGVSFTIRTRTYGGASYKTSEVRAYSDADFENDITKTAATVSASGTSFANKTATLAFKDDLVPSDVYFKITSSTTTASNGPGISEITFTYTKATASSPLSKIELSGTYPIEFDNGEEFSHEGMVVTATYEDESTKNVTDKVKFSGYNTSEAGEQEVTVSYTEGEVTKEAKYNITVHEPVAVTGVSLDRNELSLYAGASETLVATVEPSNAANKNVSWNSSNEAVATVENGVVTAVKQGSATITVTTEDGGKTAECAVTVQKSTKITFDASTDRGTSPLTKQGVSFACTNAVLDNGSEYRLYKNSTVTLSSESGNIVRIEFTCPDGYAASGFAAHEGLVVDGNNGIWTGNAESVSFVASVAQVRATEIAVTFAGVLPPALELDKTEVDLLLDNEDGVTVHATVTNVDEPTFTWSTDATNIKLENTNTDTVTIKLDTDVTGSAVVNLTVGGVTPALEASCNVNITFEEMFVTVEASTYGYSLLTDVSLLEDGDKIVITDASSLVGMKAYVSGNNCGEADISVNGGTIIDLGEAAVLTLSDAGNGKFYINDGTYYLYAASSSANHLKGLESIESETDQKNASWQFEYSTDHMNITAPASNNRKVMQYNKGNGLFSCYASDNQTNLQVYRYGGADEKIAVTAELYNAVVGFNKEFKCDSTGKSFDQAKWATAAALITSEMKTTFKLDEAKADKDGNLIEQFLARYDYAVGKWDAKLEADLDFLAREPAPVPSGSYMPLGSNAKSNAAATVIIIIAVLGVTAFGVYFLLRKRKEER